MDRIHGCHPVQKPRRTFSGQYAAKAAVYPLTGYFPGLHGSQKRPVCRLRVFGIQEQVVPGLYRLYFGVSGLITG